MTSIEGLSREEKEELLDSLKEKERRVKTRKIKSYYPEEGALRRELYVKHNLFFKAGATFTERLMMAANRVGKTEGVGAFEVTLHLTGDYPFWWEGRRFNRPTDGWAAGDSLETVRDIIQQKLLGNISKPEEYGTGLIPLDSISHYTRRQGKADAVDTIYVKHKSGGISSLGLKSYDQGRKSFQGTKKDFIWLDEEPDLDIYTEALLRTMDTSGADDADNGLMILTFTPLSGLSETVMSFLPNGEIREITEGPKFVVMATWDDAPHLTQAVKDKLWASIPPFQRDARSKGIPQLGSGAIYPVPETDILVADFEIPAHWPRFFAMDVGWNRTAVGFYAYDKENDIVYRYSEHYQGQAEPVIHAASIKARGDWIPGVIDPAARGRSQHDGLQLLQVYKDLGLDVEVAKNSVEAGIYEVWQRMTTGRFKVFKSCQNWLFEYRLYRRDEKGRIVKENDHAMDEMRYAIMSGIERAKVKPVKDKQKNYQYSSGSGSSNGWMG